MAKIPQMVLDKSPVISVLTLRSRGKVRDSYDLDQAHFSGSQSGDPKMLVVASDRCSIFDFVLNTVIPQKGEILTALNYFWLKKVIGDLCETDFVATGKEIDNFLPSPFQGNSDLQKRSTVVRVLPAPEIEDIVRLILTGSGWKNYQKDKTVGGHKLPPGLINGSLLPYPLYTPSTKAVEGHDVNITADEAIIKCGFKRERLALQVAGLLANYATSRGIRLADTKFEFSGNILVDEKGTPDSSRFMDEAEYQKMISKGKLASSLDKQFVRNWGIGLGIDKFDPEKPEDVVHVHSLVVPDYEVNMTTKIYRYIFWRLTGKKIEIFQREEMGISVSGLRPKVAIVIGSESDVPQIKNGLLLLRSAGISFVVNVISCHRNPDELNNFTFDTKADIVIAGAGKAAALPGMVKSLLCRWKKADIPVLGVAFQGASKKDDLAAVNSIECLPGQLVELNQNDEAYFGSEGFTSACWDAIHREFLPKKMEGKPAKLDFSV